MVAGEAEDAVASDELAPGPEVLGAGRGRWGSSSPVQTMTVGRDGWRWRARAAAKELRQVERKQKGTQPRRGSYAWDKGAARTRRWRLHARRGSEGGGLVGSIGARWQAADRATAALARSRGCAQDGTRGRGPA
jgi:hypothetical protein